MSIQKNENIRPCRVDKKGNIFLDNKVWYVGNIADPGEVLFACRTSDFEIEVHLDSVYTIKSLERLPGRFFVPPVFWGTNPERWEDFRIFHRDELPKRIAQQPDSLGWVCSILNTLAAQEAYLLLRKIEEATTETRMMPDYLGKQQVHFLEVRASYMRTFIIDLYETLLNEYNQYTSAVINALKQANPAEVTYCWKKIGGLL